MRVFLAFLGFLFLLLEACFFPEKSFFFAWSGFGFWVLFFLLGSFSSKDKLLWLLFLGYGLRLWKLDFFWVAWGVSFVCGFFSIFLFLGEKFFPLEEGMKRREKRIFGVLKAFLLFIGWSGLLFQFGWEWQPEVFFGDPKPKEKTLGALKTLEEPLEVGVFLEGSSRALPIVQAYLGELFALGPSPSRMGFFDSWRHLSEAKRFQVEGNGFLVLKKGKLRQKIHIPAQGITFQALDKAVYQALLRLYPALALYFLDKGLGWKTSAYGRENLGLKKMLEERNVSLLPLKKAWEGGGIPPRTALVLLLWPQEDLSSKGLKFLENYLASQGSLLLLLEPEETQRKTGKLLQWLQKKGVRFHAERVLQKEHHAYAVGEDSERQRVFVDNHGAHPVTKLLTKGKEAVLLKGAGWFQKTKAESTLEVNPLLWTKAESWADSFPDFSYNQAEENKASLPLGVALEEEKGLKILAFGDSDLFNRVQLNHPPNQKLLEGALDWLLEGEKRAILPAKAEEEGIFFLKEKGKLHKKTFLLFMLLLFVWWGFRLYGAYKAKKKGFVERKT